MSGPLFFSIKNLTFCYNQKKIFKNFSLNVKFEKLILIKGKVGSGKTTLLKIIMEYLKPSSGEVAFFDKHDNKLALKKYYLHANAEFNFVTGFIQDEIKLLGIKDKNFNFENKHVSEFSGGELKKIALEMAFKLNVDLILMDEPFEMLDDNEVLNVRNLILDMLKISDKKLIIATHEDLLDNYADFVILIPDDRDN